MDPLELTVTIVSLLIYVAALYEAITVASVAGKMPRFWLFFLAAIGFLVVRRVLVILSSSFGLVVPDYWSTLDSDGTPIIFGGLLLVWVYDMKKSFQRAAPKAKEDLVAAEHS